jgi:hypothetical protein
MCTDHKVIGPRRTEVHSDAGKGQKRLTSFWGKANDEGDGTVSKKLRSGLRSTQQVSEHGPLKPSAIDVLMKAAKVYKPSVKPRAAGGRGGKVGAAGPCKGAGTLHAFFQVAHVKCCGGPAVPWTPFLKALGK